MRQLQHIERGTWHESAFVTRAEPPLGMPISAGWLAAESLLERMFRAVSVSSATTAGAAAWPASSGRGQRGGMARLERAVSLLSMPGCLTAASSTCWIYCYGLATSSTMKMSRRRSCPQPELLSSRLIRTSISVADVVMTCTANSSG